MRITYDRGTMLVWGARSAPHCSWDSRVGALRAMAYRYGEIREALPHAVDQVMDPLPVPPLRSDIRLKPFQREALDAWMERRRGIVVLPTGAGKTFVALKAMEELSVSTLVVVPTLPLLTQWAERISEAFGVDVGVVGGGRSELRGITVITYDSAYLRAPEIGNRFLLAVFDEVHHLAAEGYIEIAESLASPYRLGLTATLEREDGRHVHLLTRVGGVVYRLGPRELAGEHLAEFDTVGIRVRLTEEERREYERLISEYRDGLRRTGLSMSSLEDFRRLVMRSGSSRAARRALISWNRARRLAINARRKLEVLEELLESHRDDKVIIFTEYNEMAEEVSRRFLIPLITHRTSQRERQEILSAFRTGGVTKVVTSKVLDEGVDVPDARVGIILGGTGSRREFIQRLGRILRKREGKRAVLYEVVTAGTAEVRTSSRRRRALRSEDSGGGR